MLALGQGKKRLSWIWAGIGIGALVSLLTHLGIRGILFFIEDSHLPKQELIIFTNLFYGIVFFIALGGLRTENKRYKRIVSRNPYNHIPPPVLSKARARFKRIKTILWIVFSAVSLGWLTPALVIFWTAPKNPRVAVIACAYLFSMVVGVAYGLGNNRNETPQPRGYLMLLVGILLSASVINGLIYQI